MKIVHYFLGFPPYRSGGLTRYAYDLMTAQKRDSNDVIALWPGQIKLFNRKPFFKKRKNVDGIINYEIINPLAVPLYGGINKIDEYIKESDITIFEKFLSEISPDVIHIHTLMGLHKEMVEAANKLNIKLVYTTHDYFGICPKVLLYKNNKVCEDDKNCELCILCNYRSISLGKIRIMQSPIYRRIKNNRLMKKVRNHVKNKEFTNTFDTNINYNKERKYDYIKLREYYLDILRKIDVIHYNSSLTKRIYEKYIIPRKSICFNITHKNIRDNQNMIKKEKSDKIRMVFLAQQADFKGFNIIKKVLDEIWNNGMKNFELYLYGSNKDLSPYMRVVADRYDNNRLEEVFKNIDLLLAPSVWYETFGFTVQEALSYGVPVIVSDNVGAKDIIGENGYIVKAGSVESFRKTIYDILKHNNVKKVKNHHVILWEEFMENNYKLYM